MMPKPFTVTDTNRADTFAASIRSLGDRELLALSRQYTARANRTGWASTVESAQALKAEMKRREDEQSGLAA